MCLHILSVYAHASVPLGRQVLYIIENELELHLFVWLHKLCVCVKLVACLMSSHVK